MNFFRDLYVVNIFWFFKKSFIFQKESLYFFQKIVLFLFKSFYFLNSFDFLNNHLRLSKKWNEFSKPFDFFAEICLNFFKSLNFRKIAIHFLKFNCFFFPKNHCLQNFSENLLKNHPPIKVSGEKLALCRGKITLSLLFNI